MWFSLCKNKHPITSVLIRQNVMRNVVITIIAIMEISVVVMVITIVSDSAVELVLFSPTMSYKWR